MTNTSLAVSTRPVENPLHQKRVELTGKRSRLLGAFERAANKNRPKRLADLYGKIRLMNELLASLDELEAQTKPQNRTGNRRFAISSLFLHESFKKLTLDASEQFFFITGSEVEGTYVLDQWAEFAHQKRSVVGVTADTGSTHKLLIKLEQFGHRLLAHFHSHPGNGEDSTNPSGTDQDFQKRLESAGHLAVMAIFSRDGYVRFLRLDDNFEISIYGEGVEQHGKSVFRLKNIG